MSTSASAAALHVVGLPIVVVFVLAYDQWCFICAGYTPCELHCCAVPLSQQLHSLGQEPLEVMALRLPQAAAPGTGTDMLPMSCLRYLLWLPLVDQVPCSAPGPARLWSKQLPHCVLLLGLCTVRMGLPVVSSCAWSMQVANVQTCSKWHTRHAAAACNSQLTQ